MLVLGFSDYIYIHIFVYLMISYVSTQFDEAAVVVCYIDVSLYLNAFRGLPGWFAEVPSINTSGSASLPLTVMRRPSRVTRSQNDTLLKNGVAYGWLAIIFAEFMALIMTHKHTHTQIHRRTHLLRNILSNY